MTAVLKNSLKANSPNLVLRRRIVVPPVDTSHPVVPDVRVLPRRIGLADIQGSRANLEARTITLTGTKTGESRIVYINDTLFGALKKVEPLPGGCFFPSRRQERYTNITKVFNNAVKNAGMRKVRFHDLRHTFKTLLLDDGANPLAVEKLMGHKLPAMLERYWHPNPTLLLDTVKRLDRILGLRASPATGVRQKEGSASGAF